LNFRKAVAFEPAEIVIDVIRISTVLPAELATTPITNTLSPEFPVSTYDTATPLKPERLVSKGAPDVRSVVSDG